MNIPQIYLVEPYNAYAPKGRKKHWMEEVEEQALLARIIAEQQARQIAEQQALIEANQRTSNTLPPQAPDTATPTIVGNTSGEGAAGGKGSGAGGGGTPVWDFWNPAGDVVNFDRSPSTGAGPLTVTFTNQTTTPQFDKYNWEFTMDGVTITSTDQNPVIVFQTGSTNPTVITASLQATNSVTNVPEGRSPDVYTLVSFPTVTAAFTYVTSSNVAPFTATFTNGSSTTSQTPPTLIYRWEFTDNTGAVTSSSLATPPVQTVQSGSFTASLQATGSYGIASMVTHSFLAPAPSLAISFTVASSSIYSPSLVTLTPTITYNGHGTLSGFWGSGEWAEGGNEYTLPTITTWTNRLYDTRSSAVAQDGKFTASLHVTESSYGIKALYTQSFALTLPSVIAAFTTTSFGFGGVENSYMEPVTMSYTDNSVYKGNGTLTYKWDFGSASFFNGGLGAQTGTATTVGPFTRADYVAGAYTASLQVTESFYGIASKGSRIFTVST